MIEKNIPRFPLSSDGVLAHSQSAGVYSARPLSGYTPSMLRNAYRAQADCTGKGVKISVICALDNVAIAESLDIFCKEFSLPSASLSVHYPLGRASGTDNSWLTESSLDTQWAHAFSPDAELSAVFSKDTSLDSMLSSAEYASDTLGSDIVLMCFGRREGADLSAQTDFFGKKNCIFIASSGDEGGAVFYPSSSPDVISVGGTKLSLSPNTHTRINETAWQNSGAGPSAVFPLSDAQRNFDGISALSGGMRATPDLSLCASHEPGCACHVAALGGWTTVSGTSLSAACFSGICACIKERHPEITNTRLLSEFLYRKAGENAYSSPQYNYHDIIFGKSGMFSAFAGWDFATGLGSPVIRQLLL